MQCFLLSKPMFWKSNLQLDMILWIYGIENSGFHFGNIHHILVVVFLF